MNIPKDAQLVSKWCNMRVGARKRGVYFDLPLNSLRNIMKAKTCYYTGVALTNANRSVDRVDNNKGYIAGNVVACDTEFNSRKGSVTIDDLRLLTKTMEARGIL